MTAASFQDDSQQSNPPQSSKPLSKAMFIVRTLEPDRAGGSRKQVSREFIEPSKVLIQDDPEKAEEEARMLMEQ